MDWQYFWSQVFTVIEYGLLGLSYFAKKRKLVVVLDIFSMLSGIVAFILLGADLGMAMSVIILLANFYYLYDSTKHSRRRKLRLKDYIILTVVLVGIVGVTIATYDGPLSLLSVVATILYEISIWQKSTKVYKFLGIPVAFCWMTYNGFVRSIFGVICEAGMLLAAIIGFVRELQAEKERERRKQKYRVQAKPKTHAKLKLKEEHGRS